MLPACRISRSNLALSDWHFSKRAFQICSALRCSSILNVAITRRYVEESEVAAAELKVSIELVEARRLDDLEKAFDAMVRARVEAVAINAEGLFFQGRQIVPKLALERRLPTCVYSR